MVEMVVKRRPNTYAISIEVESGRMSTERRRREVSHSLSHCPPKLKLTLSVLVYTNEATDL